MHQLAAESGMPDNSRQPQNEKTLTELRLVSTDGLIEMRHIHWRN
jgi:hypothetical protein